MCDGDVLLCSSARNYSRISPRNVCGRFGLSNGNVRFSDPKLVSVRKRIVNIAGLGKAYARWPASVESLGPSIAWPLLQEQWRIMRIRIIVQVLVYYYALLV